MANDSEIAGGVSILLGNGDGTFQSPVEYSTGACPDTVIAGDFDGDGNLDLAVGVQCGSIPSVSILLGNGDGTFRPGSTYNMSGLPQSLALGDFNGDGKLDIVTAWNSTLAILMGNGDGTFQSPTDYPAQGQPESLAPGDFDENGRLDMASANGGSVSVFLQSPVVSLSPSALSFGNQNVGTSSTPQNVTLTNTGSAILKISSIVISVASPFHQTNNCPSSLAAGAKCTISVKFRPGNKGVFHGAVSVTDNAPGSPQEVPLTGTGTFVQLVPTKLNFGTQPVGTRSLAKKITLTNKGNSAVKITGIAITGADPGDFSEINTCGKSVASGASCFIKVTFKPLAKGKRTGDVSVYDNGGGSPQQAMLIGTGT